MSGAMHVCGVPTTDRLVRKGHLDKAILEHRPKCHEGESCDSLQNVFWGWEPAVPGPRSMLGRLRRCKQARAAKDGLKTGCTNKEDRRQAQEVQWGGGGQVHGGPRRPRQNLGFYSG